MEKTPRIQLLFSDDALDISYQPAGKGIKACIVATPGNQFVLDEKSTVLTGSISHTVSTVVT
jgi:hypothetical protein